MFITNIGFKDVLVGEGFSSIFATRDMIKRGNPFSQFKVRLDMLPHSSYPRHDSSRAAEMCDTQVRVHGPSTFLFISAISWVCAITHLLCKAFSQGVGIMCLPPVYVRLTFPALVGVATKQPDKNYQHRAPAYRYSNA